MSKYYCFSQNNSGGSFITDLKAGIGYTVWIEANSAKEANKRAESIGIYFNGCAGGLDCICCGDRWNEVEGDEWDISDSASEIIKNYEECMWQIPDFIHYLNGTIEQVGKYDENQ